MEIQVPGLIIQLTYHPLDEQMDAYLKILFTRFFEKPNLIYSEFMKENYNDLLKYIFSYFDKKIGDPHDQDFLFNNLATVWSIYQGNGRVGEAQQFWNDILNIVIEWEQSRNERIHKGSIFYFWSQSAIIQGQLDKGFFLIHSWQVQRP